VKTLVLVFICSLVAGQAAEFLQALPKDNPIRVRVEFTAEVPDTFASHFRRSLRELGDVALVDTNAEMHVVIATMGVQQKIGAKTERIGYSIAWVVTDILEVNSLTNLLGTVATLEAGGRMKTVDLLNGHGDGERIRIMGANFAAPSDLRERAEQLAAEIDTSVIEADRSQHRATADWYREWSRTNKNARLDFETIRRSSTNRQFRLADPVGTNSPAKKP
jgi:hypothetical protein